MQPYTRETIVDRRQPAVRWSAVFAGTAVAVGVWLLFELLGMASSSASLLAPLVAIFIGGFLGAKLAATRDDKIGALHGVIVWAIASVLGVLLAVAVVAAIVPHTVAIYDDTYMPLAPRHETLRVAHHAGKALLAAGTGMLLSLGTAVIGGILAVRGFGEKRRGHRTHDTLQTPAVPPPPMDTAV